jgi:hypothetical protein
LAAVSNRNTTSSDRTSPVPASGSPCRSVVVYSRPLASGLSGNPLE